MVLATFVMMAMMAGAPQTPFGSAPPAVADSTAPQQPVTVEARRPDVVPFASNGCSGFREATFFSCCFVHDLAYWSGGNRTERAQADRALWRCLYDVSGEHIVAGIGFILVRLGAIPGQFVRDGWGRAWYNTDRGKYTELTTDQRQVVTAERTRICQSLRVDPKTGWFRVDDRRAIRPQQAREICGGDPLRR
jgi:hypothetical protein